nr:long chain acyl-CoA synthetase 1-like [Tanacetum cinerariifolium]
SGGAPLSSEIEEFLRVTSCAFVLQGYGMTETCGLAILGYPDGMCMLGAVDSAFVYTDLRLEEVPDMGYDPLADPPRGEICLRGKTSFVGYYKNPELNEVMKDGWFHTGGISVEPKTFEEQADLLTATLKKRRDGMLKLYEEGIHSHYKNLIVNKR